MKPLNIYRADADQAVWDTAEQDAKAAGSSLSGYLVGVLRRAQEVPHSDEYVRDTLAENMPQLTIDQLDTLTSLVLELANERVADVSRVEVAGARIATSAVVYPNGRIGVDAAGNLVSVEFEERVIAE